MFRFVRTTLQPPIPLLPHYQMNFLRGIFQGYMQSSSSTPTAMSAVKEIVDKYIAENHVMVGANGDSSHSACSQDSDICVFTKVFSKSYCPYCRKAKSLLDTLKVNYLAIELDSLSNGGDMQNYLQTISGQGVEGANFRGEFSQLVVTKDELASLVRSIRFLSEEVPTVSRDFKFPISFGNASNSLFAKCNTFSVAVQKIDESQKCRTGLLVPSI
ncbi:thioredoxin reductase [Dinochytrium kinnereticum]|nr:thioredoxin reductase [Dinochytrium kinnereticum]